MQLGQVMHFAPHGAHVCIHYEACKPVERIGTHVLPLNLQVQQVAYHYVHATLHGSTHVATPAPTWHKQRFLYTAASLGMLKPCYQLQKVPATFESRTLHWLVV